MLLRRQRAKDGRTRRTFPPDTPAAAAVAPSSPPPPPTPVPLDGGTGAPPPLLVAPLPAEALLGSRGALRPAVARYNAGGQAQGSGERLRLAWVRACSINCVRLSKYK